MGWAAVSSEPMDWAEFQTTRRLLAEMGPGRRIRQSQSAEDAAFESVRRELGG